MDPSVAWTIAGIIVTVLMGYLPIYLGRRQVQTPQPKGDSTPQPKGDDTSCRPEALAANPEYRMQPYPKDIFDEIGREPLAQQRLARANYVGLKVSWRTTLDAVLSVHPDEQNRAQLMMLDRGTNPWVLCEVDFLEHPEAKIARKGHGLWVNGEIAEVGVNDITLVKADLAFD